MTPDFALNFRAFFSFCRDRLAAGTTAITVDAPTGGSIGRILPSVAPERMAIERLMLAQAGAAAGVRRSDQFVFYGETILTRKVEIIGR